MIKIRSFPERNYWAVFNTETGKTQRMYHDATKPMQPLEYPEILDVSVNTRCLAGCHYCYVSAIKDGIDFENVVDKIWDFWGNMDENQRPFQVAYGGSGEPTMHPDFPAILEATYDLGIMPNYTTNGMHLTESVLRATQRFCGGVAVSCHPHLEKVWKRAIKTLRSYDIKTCLHVIVGEEGTSDKFWEIYEETKDDIHYYVALPYMAVGRAKEIEVKGEWDKFFVEFEKRKIPNVSFGALFYDYFLENPDIVKKNKIEVYEPEILSGYVMMDDSYKLIRKSSYDTTPKFETALA